MLRIDIHQEPEATSFTVAGKLVGPWVMELEKCWRAAISTEPRRAIRVNLAAVAFIDAKGRELLTRMRRQGVTLVPTGCLMKAIVDEIEGEVEKRKHSVTSLTEG
ncbi:MAG TPA: hypothetical protein VNO70_13590 [Blastocatellia bacterium]|nr:hypothetical protein [Blastocatellia bacterium]